MREINLQHKLTSQLDLKERHPAVKLVEPLIFKTPHQLNKGQHMNMLFHKTKNFFQFKGQAQKDVIRKIFHNSSKESLWELLDFMKGVNWTNAIQLRILHSGIKSPPILQSIKNVHFVDLKWLQLNQCDVFSIELLQRLYAPQLTKIQLTTNHTVQLSSLRKITQMKKLQTIRIATYRKGLQFVQGFVEWNAEIYAFNFDLLSDIRTLVEAPQVIQCIVKLSKKIPKYQADIANKKLDNLFLRGHKNIKK